MNYRKIYMKIIKRAKNENRQKGLGTYYEEHHILPKSLFPLWEKEKRNLVLLTAREHYICHMMLTKIYGNIMIYALWRLANDKQNNYCIKGSKEYEQLKIKFALLNSEIKKIQLKGFKHTLISRKHMRDARIGIIFSDNHLKSLSKAAYKRWENPNEIKKQAEKAKLRTGDRATHSTPHSNQTKQLLSNKISKFKHWNNGKISKFCEICPEGFKPGRIIRKKYKHIITGKIKEFITGQPIPSEYKRIVT